MRVPYQVADSPANSMHSKTSLSPGSILHTDALYTSEHTYVRVIHMPDLFDKGSRGCCAIEVMVNQAQAQAQGA